MGRGEKLDISFDNIDDGWSADRVCKNCGENMSECRCNEKPPSLLPKEHKILLKEQRRRGKKVTVAGEFFLSKGECSSLLKRVKKELSCGGSFKNGYLIIQGSVSERLKSLLKSYGFN